MWWKILISCVVITISGNFALADCPSADLTGDGFVDFEDFALMAAQWLSGEPNIPDDMVYIPSGWFAMGDHHGDGTSDERPLHGVLLDSFYMSKYEITNQQYCDYLNAAYGQGTIWIDGSGVVYATGGSDPYCDTYPSSLYSAIYLDFISFYTLPGKADHPMVMVSWYGAAAYCNWRSGEEGKEQCYDLSTWSCDFSKHGYRLATEAEWEYAARGGEHSPYYRYAWGDSIDGSKANYWASGDPYETGDYPWTTPVGYYDGSQIPAGSDMANGYGLYDMVGNVWEWCNDRYGSDYYDTSPYDNPEGPASGTYRVYRGGSWGDVALYCRVALRLNYCFPFNRYIRGGFRIVLDF